MTSVDLPTENINMDDFANKTVSTKPYSVGHFDPKYKPPHPKDDSNISQGKTPEDYNARGCIFCGSLKHWDRDCKYKNTSSLRNVRSLLVDACSSEELLEEVEYEKCYNESIRDSNSETEEVNNEEYDLSNDHETSEESDF